MGRTIVEQTSPLRLLCVLAHPDDESMGAGGLLALSAADGIETYLLTATRGERGWGGPPAEHPGLEALGRLREGELRAAAAVLGVRAVSFLDFIDGDLDQAEPAVAIARLVGHLRRLRPQVVVTIPPDGYYGHPDHIAISQFTSAALVCAADAAYADPVGQAPHRVAKFYFSVDTAPVVALFEAVAGGPITMEVDGQVRCQVGWPEWSITTRLDASAHWRTVVRAIGCHRSQLGGFPDLAGLPDETNLALWGYPTLYRVFSLVNGGRALETDIFAGLR